MAVQVPGLGQDLVPGKVLDLEEVDLALQPGDLVLELLSALLQGAVGAAEAVSADLVLHVKPVHLLHLLVHPALFGLEPVQERPLVRDRLVSLLEVVGHLLRRKEELPKLLLEDGLQIDDGDLVPAVAAHVLRGVGGDVHLLAAGTDREPGEEVHCLSCRALAALSPFVEECVALLPQLHRHDWLHLAQDPLVPGLLDPVLLVAEAPRVVGPADPLGRWVAEEPLYGRVAEAGAVPRAVALLIEKSGHRFLPPMLQKQLVHEPADRRLLGVGNQLPILPLVPERCLAAQGLAEFGADRHRSRHAFSDLLTLPLGHRRDHGVEEAARRRGRVDGLLERDEVRVVRAEDLGELQELFGISGQARELGEDESGDAPAPHVSEHPLRVGEADDGLPAHRIKAVDLPDLPALGFRIAAGPSLVVLGAFARHLVLGTHANPDTHRFRLRFGCLLYVPHSSAP